MLLEIAIGDAYGAGFEFAPKSEVVQFGQLLKYRPHPLGIAAGKYTDDTQMSIAVAECILQHEQPDKLAFADAFVATYRRDPRDGYAKGLQQLMEECATGKDLLQRIRPNSTRNGAAMRSVPLGVISDRMKLMGLAEVQASVTHDTWEGRLSAQAVALMAHFAYHEISAWRDLPEFLSSETHYCWTKDWHGEVACDALQTVNAVLSALTQEATYSGLLRRCIHYGGDVDSVAAIAMGVASLSSTYRNDLPRHLIEDLESGPYGLRFLTSLDLTLHMKYKSPSATNFI